MKHLKSCIFFLLVAISLLDASPSNLFERGNVAYEQKEYQQAIQLYDSLLNQGYYSANLYFNLGNAQYKKGQIAEAIYYYEKAKEITGHRPGIEYNLRMARQQTRDQIEAIPQLFIVRWFNTLVNTFSSKAWATISIIFLWLTLGGAAFYIFFKALAIRKFGFFSSAVFLFLFGICMIMGYQRHQNVHADDEAIVFATNAYIKSTPDVSGTDLFILHEGVKVEVVDQVEAWNQIQLPDGKQGWIKEAAIKRI